MTEVRVQLVSESLYCQVGFHIQGIFTGVFGADLNIENRKYLFTININ